MKIGPLGGKIRSGREKGLFQCSWPRMIFLKLVSHPKRNQSLKSLILTQIISAFFTSHAGAGLGGRCRGCAPHPLPSPRDNLQLFNATGILQKTLMRFHPVTVSYAI